MANGRYFGRRTARVTGLAMMALLLTLGLLTAVFAKASHASTTANGLPPGLQPTQVNVTNDLTHRYGEPVVMANPKNPNNLVYFVLGPDLNTACEQAHTPECTVGQYGFPNGLLTTNGWQHDHVFTSFDRGKTWAPATFPNGYTFPCCVGPGGTLEGSSDPNITATPDGTFYIGFDVQSSIANGIPNYAAGVGVAKSTDGGRTWSQPVIVGTPIDRPWMTSDPTTGTVYIESGSPPANGILGPYSTGDPSSPASAVSDRWVVSSQDGVHWTTPHRLGGATTSSSYPISGSSAMSAGHGVLATTFAESTGTACAFFTGASAPCSVFQTSTDSGVTWTRHNLPVPANAAGTRWLAADPTRAGHYTVMVEDSASSEMLVYRTSDSGVTWQGPMVVTEDTSVVHYKPWVSYSPDGVLGIMWRSTVPVTTSAVTTNSAITSSQITLDALTVPADDPGSDPTDCNIPPGVSEDCNDGDPPVGAYTIWAAISYDGGATFSNPLEISTAPSPVPPATASQSFDDDSYISLDHQDAFIAWADWRPGERQGYFSAVKLQAFTFPGR